MWVPDPKQLGRYLELSQIGLEMVVPIAIGAILDSVLEWAPWGTIVGAFLGLIGGMAHLIAFLNRKPDSPAEKKPDSPP